MKDRRRICNHVNTARRWLARQGLLDGQIPCDARVLLDVAAALDELKKDKEITTGERSRVLKVLYSTQSAIVKSLEAADGDKNRRQDRFRQQLAAVVSESMGWIDPGRLTPTVLAAVAADLDCQPEDLLTPPIVPLEAPPPS